MHNHRYITGLCSDDIPESEKQFLRVVTERLMLSGYTMRTGGLIGTSEPFIRGAMDAAVIQDVSVPSLELYVPSPEVDTFGINPKQVFDIHQLKEMKSGRIMAMAALHRDRYLTISNKRALEYETYVPALMGGDINDISRFMICWAPAPQFDKNQRQNDCHGCMSTAVKIAHTYSMQVFNTAIPAHKTRLLRWITGDVR